MSLTFARAFCITRHSYTQPNTHTHRNTTRVAPTKISHIIPIPPPTHPMGCAHTHTKVIIPPLSHAAASLLQMVVAPPTTGQETNRVLISVMVLLPLSFTKKWRTDKQPTKKRKAQHLTTQNVSKHPKHQLPPPRSLSNLFLSSQSCTPPYAKKQKKNKQKQRTTPKRKSSLFLHPFSTSHTHPSSHAAQSYGCVVIQTFAFFKHVCVRRNLEVEKIFLCGVVHCPPSPLFVVWSVCVCLPDNVVGGAADSTSFHGEVLGKGNKGALSLCSHLVCVGLCSVVSMDMHVCVCLFVGQKFLSRFCFVLAKKKKNRLRLDAQVLSSCSTEQ